VAWPLLPKGLRLHNPVSLDSEKGALVFERNGIAYVDRVQSAMPVSEIDEFTILIIGRAGSLSGRDFRSILMLHDGDDRRQLIVGQWKSSIVAMNGDDYDHTRRLPRLIGNGVLSAEAAQFICITSDDRGTRLYVDGRLVNTRQGWRLVIPKQRRAPTLVIGNSVSAKNSWVGEIHGISMVDRALSSALIERYHASWKKSGRFPDHPTDHTLYQYIFAGAKIPSVPDQSRLNQPLTIPRRPVVLSKSFLSPPWHHFKLNRSFAADSMLNLLGFIPLGALLFGWLQHSFQRTQRIHLAIVIGFCFLLSLTMEIVQAWLPTRSSSLLDLFLNTLGAWCGIKLFKWTAGAVGLRLVPPPKH